MNAPASTGLVDVGTLARLFVLTPRRIQQLASEGIIPKGERGRYPLAPAITGYVTWLQKRVSGESDLSDLTTQRARLAKAQAEKTELEAAELRGQMVRVSEVEEDWARHVAGARARMLAMPSKVAPRARVAETDEAASRLIEHEILEALEELSYDGIPDATRARRERASAIMAPTAAADSERVVGQLPEIEPRKRGRTRQVAD